jgi:hypothetical protein
MYTYYARKIILLTEYMHIEFRSADKRYFKNYVWAC